MQNIDDYIGVMYITKIKVIKPNRLSFLSNDQEQINTIHYHYDIQPLAYSIYNPAFVWFRDSSRNPIFYASYRNSLPTVIDILLYSGDSILVCRLKQERACSICRGAEVNKLNCIFENNLVKYCYFIIDHSYIICLKVGYSVFFNGLGFLFTFTS